MVQPDLWSYRLAPDVSCEVVDDQVHLRSPAGGLRFPGTEHAELAKILSQDTVAEVVMASNPRTRDVYAAFLFRLDQRGFLSRSLIVGEKIVATCNPRRAPAGGLPEGLSARTLKLSSQTLLQPFGAGFRVQRPGGWAEIELTDARLGELLFDLVIGIEADRINAEHYDLNPQVLDALLRLFDWCELLETSDANRVPVHEALFHSRTRMGFSQAPVGKTGFAAPTSKASPEPQILLEKPDLADLIAQDPPYALVAHRRKSRRSQAHDPISCEQLGALLFRCFYEENGRRPYPSGGGLHPLTAYLVVNRCDGLESGLYRYDARHHGLSLLTNKDRSLDALLADAAAAADCKSLSQVLLLLSADMPKMRASYGDLAYSLVLKEVGAVFQTVQLSGAAMNLAICPLGTGNALRFAQLTGLDSVDRPSVGEMMIGSAERS